MPIFPEELSQMEHFDYLRNKGLITDDNFNELKELDEKIKAGFISASYLGSNRLTALKELFIRKRKYYIDETNYEFMAMKEELINCNGTFFDMDSLISNTKAEEDILDFPKTRSSHFEAIVLKDNYFGYTSSSIFSSDKRKIVFADPEKARYDVPYDLMEQGFTRLWKNYPELFQEAKCLIKKTDRHIEYFDYFTMYNRRKAFSTHEQNIHGLGNLTNEAIQKILSHYLSDITSIDIRLPKLLDYIKLNVYKYGDYNPDILELHLDKEVNVSENIMDNRFWILSKRKTLTMGRIIKVL